MSSDARNTGRLAFKMASHFNSIHNTVIGVIVLFILSAFMCAVAVIGYFNIHECLVHRMIPIWLIATGAAGVVGFGFLIILVNIVFYLSIPIVYFCFKLICRVWCCYEDDSHDICEYCSWFTLWFFWILYFAWTIVVSKMNIKHFFLIILLLINFCRVLFGYLVPKLMCNSTIQLPITIVLNLLTILHSDLPLHSFPSL
jgi:hypothetical protein